MSWSTATYNVAVLIATGVFVWLVGVLGLVGILALQED